MSQTQPIKPIAKPEEIELTEGNFYRIRTNLKPMSLFDYEEIYKLNVKRDILAEWIQSGVTSLNDDGSLPFEPKTIPYEEYVEWHKIHGEKKRITYISILEFMTTPIGDAPPVIDIFDDITSESLARVNDFFTLGSAKQGKTNAPQTKSANDSKTNGADVKKRSKKETSSL
jgi:hypothetical protein